MAVLPFISLPFHPIYCSTILYTFGDLKVMAEQLSTNFKADLSKEFMKKIRYQFHSASYHLMTGVVMVLRTVAGHLLNAVSEKEEEVLEKKTVNDFISEIYKDSNKEECELFHKIGLQVPDSNPDHNRCLAKLPLTATYSCLELFIKWVEEGFYNFSTLPFPFKASLSEEQKLVVENLRDKWTGTAADFMNGLEDFIVNVLKHSELSITKQHDETVINTYFMLILIIFPLQKSIVEYLSEISVIDDEDVIPRYIPHSINLCHYVELRLALRK